MYVQYLEWPMKALNSKNLLEMRRWLSLHLRCTSDSLVIDCSERTACSTGSDRSYSTEKLAYSVPRPLVQLASVAVATINFFVDAKVQASNAASNRWWLKDPRSAPLFTLAFFAIGVQAFT